MSWDNDFGGVYMPRKWEHASLRLHARDNPEPSSRRWADPADFSLLRGELKDELGDRITFFQGEGVKNKQGAGQGLGRGEQGVGFGEQGVVHEAKARNEGRCLKDVVRFQEGAPLNPVGRTGLCGRGMLGKWGPNHALDPIVTRYHPKTGQLQMMATQREDTMQWAIPVRLVGYEPTPHRSHRQLEPLQEDLRFQIPDPNRSRSTRSQADP